MADTHINAFFADVEEKKQAVVLAQGELDAAKARLAAKKKEVGYVEPKPVESPKLAPAQEVQHKDTKKK